MLEIKNIFRPISRLDIAEETMSELEECQQKFSKLKRKEKKKNKKNRWEHPQNCGIITKV